MRKITFGIVVALVASGCAVNPVTGKREITFVSTSSEIAMGEQNYAPMQQSQGGEYDVDPALTIYVQGIGNRLVFTRPDLLHLHHGRQQDAVCMGQGCRRQCLCQQECKRYHHAPGNWC